MSWSQINWSQTNPVKSYYITFAFQICRCQWNVGTGWICMSDFLTIPDLRDKVEIWSILKTVASCSTTQHAEECSVPIRTELTLNGNLLTFGVFYVHLYSLLLLVCCSVIWVQFYFLFVTWNLIISRAIVASPGNISHSTNLARFLWGQLTSSRIPDWFYWI